MTTETRRLSAIFVSDIVGYTRMMEADETATWSRVKAFNAEILSPEVAKCGGRVVKTTGDGVLAEFPSVASAVGCAKALQVVLKDENAAAQESEPFKLRIGIDVGDVIVDDGDVFGETVNVAARLQTLSPPGGFCLSHRAFDNLGDRQMIALEDIGDCDVRNMSRPIAALIWRPELEMADGASRAGPWRSGIARQDRDAGRPSTPDTQNDFRVEQPSIAILPFETSGGDVEHEYFADGLAEELTTQIARFKSLFVIARTSAFAHREKDRDPMRVGRALGVEYVVEGSVRHAGERMRIRIRMIEVSNGRQHWSERFDRPIDDIFAVQDEIVELVVSTLIGKVEADRILKAQRKPTESLRAYDLVLRGLAIHKSGVESYVQMADAAELFRRAAEIDPTYARAHAWRACSTARLLPRNATTDERERHLRSLVTLCQRALELDPDDAEAHRVMAALLLLSRDFDRAEHHIERALASNPNHALVAIKAANFFCYAGKLEKADALVARAVRLNPYFPDWYWLEFGFVHFSLGRYRQASEALGRAQSDGTEFRNAYLAAALVLAGLVEQGRSLGRRIVEANSDFRIGAFMMSQPFRNAAMADRLSSALKAAGLPD